MSMFARRNVAAEVTAIDDHNERRRVVPLERDGLPRASSLAVALDDAERDVRAVAEMAPYVPVKHQPEQPTDLEQIALWVRYLTYTDMKALMIEVYGEARPTTLGEVADLWEAWAIRKLAPKSAEDAQ